jgi:hypothetical protein
MSRGWQSGPLSGSMSTGQAERAITQSTSAPKKTWSSGQLTGGLMLKLPSGAIDRNKP